MNVFKRLFKKIFLGKEIAEPVDVEKLRLDFRERYARFKHLISANNKALEIMTDLERAFNGTSPFGMTFVRAKATTVSVNVYQMVENLLLLAPGKYDALIGRFKDISKKINQVLIQKKPIQDKRLIIPLSTVDKGMADLVGSKMANLGEIKNKIKLKVPSGFVITSFAYEQFIDHNDLRDEIARCMQSADLDDIENLYTLHAHLHQLIDESEIPPELEDAVRVAWQEIEEEAGSRVTVAMRSSALGEDREGSSFAGLHLSELNVSAEHVLDSYKEIVASKYSLQAITYRLNKGFKDEDVAMCVGCLVMVDSLAGGVIYSRNPIDIKDDSIFISAAWGLPTAVVDGTVDVDLFVVSREVSLKIIRRDIREKERKFVCYPLEGVCRIDLTEDTNRSQASIDDQQAVSLAEIAIKMEGHYGTPQDIEWAIGQNGEIYVLQCRPLYQTESIKRDLSEGIEAKHKETVILEGGITASPGTTSGTVYRVISGLDILEFPQGAILLTHDAQPRWASLLNRASGVITEHGSFAGHLANVAREFGLPALFGVPGAADKLSTGVVVTLDATGRSIHKGLVANLLTDTESKHKQSLMIGSPVHETLKQVNRYIIPLNLLDPDSLDFTPENCLTFHDITRFIHEKSVHEMFNFGKDHNFTERSSKQLYYNVPMQWWVLNLDDGFKEEVAGKYIKLENIASIPMIAFWEGFTAVQWDGPPAIDGKGLMSVLFQASANTSLTSGMRQKFVDQNYFMISKNYCNLNSRLGYHFSIMEALIGDHPTENYVSFQFKGGAADSDRRFKRAHFIKKILEDYGFRVDVKEDNLVSRVEGHEKKYMLDRLKILGYLTLHTRQLDMIMTNRAKVNYYRSKLKKDIHKFLQTPPDVNGS